ncbi:hypothetical protein KSC_109900 [Ktedonobacter sp. SOSP1-52]|uniref:hypothetical protein n=1 Tax=Ktedonobacter sp. SOSP1-52 TaxID=2778366 RepID=UPI0019154A24|nr:hypothetical protein [Ktedonobacter sp. SOSP1-52]GHO72098.1 hypothetical protein KSC_109900 [Ktedonobacter sp. SOSP1-52]
MPPIDVSVGLVKALPLLGEYYKENALLQAELPARVIPGVRERCLCVIPLSMGKPVSCYIEKKDGQRQNVPLEVVKAADTRRGPFEWSLQPVKQPQPPQIDMSPQAPQYTYAQPQPPQHYAPPQLPQLPPRTLLRLQLCRLWTKMLSPSAYEH